MDVTGIEDINDINVSLNIYFYESHVYNVLKAIKLSKAPSPDGVNPFFFQHFWDIVGHDVTFDLFNGCQIYITPKIS